ncbi:MAG: peptide chain release factor N(5)-glutamine methyltransferase [Lachnospiraceae bacterium]|nr:peptide chain release factor N(5)-glutamine methyltransferase [Lachnospiraceae bacterium]
MTYFEAYRQAAAELEAAGVPEPAIDARYLTEYVGDLTEAQYLLARNEEIPADSLLRLKELTQRRCAREPIQYILGSQEFMGLPFICNKDCLIPRQDTEILAERALEAVKVLRRDRDEIRYLDLCTGSGCVAISVTKLGNITDAEAADISAAALAVAKKNAELNGTKLKLIEADLFEGLEGRYDIITANPPYIDTGLIHGLIPEIWKYEPMTALDGGEDGLVFYRRIVGEAPQRLTPGGWLVFEIGDTQGEAVAALMKAAGFEQVAVLKDLAGLDRVVEGRQTASALKGR